MQTLEEVLLENSQIPIAKLYGPAKKAAAAPQTGITANVPAALKVIQDSATIAVEYLPLHVCGLAGANIFVRAKKKVTLEQIREFVARAETHIASQQLLHYLLYIARNIPIPAPSQTEGGIDKDPYGEYDTANIQTTVDSIYILSNLFGVV